MANVALLSIPAAVTAVARLLAKIADLIDPKARKWVRREKALDWGEKYILTNEKIEHLQSVKPFTAKEAKKVETLLRKREYYRKWFFDFN